MGLNWTYEFNVCGEDAFDISLETDDIVDLVHMKKVKKY